MRAIRQLREAPFLAATFGMLLALILPWAFTDSAPAGDRQVAGEQSAPLLLAGAPAETGAR
ncbi:hypothetical protein [Roseococcus sp. YIM B11640]|uniref:hypothetical protein n=1 Tax=Roseococcus sp. YIM B11640 TaxID=3133973 RepID=UPI003C7A9B0B